MVARGKEKRKDYSIIKGGEMRKKEPLNGHSVTVLEKSGVLVIVGEVSEEH